jgi:hypothetical protein
VTRPDLASRAIFLTLEPIAEEDRRTEDELWKEFERQLPAILGAILDALVVGLKRLPETKLPAPPRMADFALWATACETASWPEGTFLAAYRSNAEKAAELGIDADVVASAVRMLMTAPPPKEPSGPEKLRWEHGDGKTRKVWEGTATELLSELKWCDGELSRSKAWPSTPGQLSGRLRRVAPLLRQTGIEVDFIKVGHERDRIIRITTTPPLQLVSTVG